MKHFQGESGGFLINVCCLQKVKSAEYEILEKSRMDASKRIFVCSQMKPKQSELTITQRVFFFQLKPSTHRI